MDQGLKAAIKAAGSGNRLAAMLGVSQQAVQQWRRMAKAKKLKKGVEVVSAKLDKVVII